MMSRNRIPQEERYERRDGEMALFEAILEPHRSLSPRGFLILMSAVAVVSFLAGVAFFIMGAWPVLGFFGLDAVLIYVAFRVNFHSAQICETVKLTERELTVERKRPNGQVSNWSFQTYWLRVGVEDGDSRLTLSSHGKTLTIGEFLTPGERIDLAVTLREELQKLRQPHHESVA